MDHNINNNKKTDKNTQGVHLKYDKSSVKPCVIVLEDLIKLYGARSASLVF